MKIIEAMKECKRLAEKVTDLRVKITQHCANMDYEKPVYADPRAQVAEWQQSIHDSLKRIEVLRVAIQRTNLATNVRIEIDGEAVEKSIANWIHRRRDLAGLEMASWTALTDRGLKDGFINSAGGTQTKVAVVRHFDPLARDKKIELYRNEPMLIDATLETVNAVTDLIE